MLGEPRGRVDDDEVVAQRHLADDELHESDRHGLVVTGDDRREDRVESLGVLGDQGVEMLLGRAAEARLDGIDDDCMAMSCLFAAFAELVATYGEEAAATYADSLSKRIASDRKRTAA